MNTINDHDIQGMPLRLLFVRYLMASFLYYIHDLPSPWSDQEYDQACKRLLAEWKDFEHPHKYLTDESALKAGSGFHMRWYPVRTQLAAFQWAREAGLEV